MEYEGAEAEADEYATPANHGDDADHGSVVAECIEIHEIGSGEEYTDADDAPSPMEGGGALMCRPP